MRRSPGEGLATHSSVLAWRMNSPFSSHTGLLPALARIPPYWSLLVSCPVFQVTHFLLNQVCSSEIFPDHNISKISTLIFHLLTLLSFWFIAFHNLIDYIYSFIVYFRLPWWLSGKESTWNAGDVGLIPGSERSSGEGNGNPSQYSRLENSMDRGAWQVTTHGVAKSQTRLSMHA